MNRHQRRAYQARVRKQRGYMHRLLAAPLDQLRGKVSIAAISHDEWCGVNHGRGCDCCPDISLHPIDGGDVTVIDEDGETREVTPS